MTNNQQMLNFSIDSAKKIVIKYNILTKTTYNEWAEKL